MATSPPHLGDVGGLNVELRDLFLRLLLNCLIECGDLKLISNPHKGIIILSSQRHLIKVLPGQSLMNQIAILS